MSQVEQILRAAISDGRFAGGKLPAEVELAGQLGVSRETVRRAAEVLAREGLLVKFRRKGTFLKPPALRLPEAAQAEAIGYVQAEYGDASDAGAPERHCNSLMLQGALEAASAGGFELAVRRAPTADLQKTLQYLQGNARLRGVVFASVGEEKVLRRFIATGVPAVLLDHDANVPHLPSVRDDSAAGACLAVLHLARLGHRRIAYALWRQADLNPWRLEGYRRGLTEAGLPRRRKWEFPVELNAAGARAVVDALEKLAPAPTGIFCFDNTLAQLVVEEASRRGRRVPEDLSVVGGGGSNVLGLACSEADWHQMGRVAVETVLRVAKRAGASRRHHLIPHTFKPGATTAPPAA